MSFLKGAVIFTVGVGVGVSGSYIIFKKKYDEREEDLKELKNHYNKKILEEAEKKDDEKKVDKIIKDQKYVPYDKMNADELKAKIIEKGDEAIMNDSPKEDYPEEAFVITEEDYSERELYFEKVELDYYVEDEALVDEGHELTDVNATIGWDILDKFIKEKNEEVIYVRNAKNNTDYLVNKCFGKYSDIVGLGGDESDD